LVEKEGVLEQTRRNDILAVFCASLVVCSHPYARHILKKESQFHIKEKLLSLIYIKQLILPTEDIYYNIKAKLQRK
jgi:hypothetical protein